MNAAKREAREALRIATARAVAALERRGICWQQWARERGLDGQAVKDVVGGRAPAIRGEAFRAAEAIRAEARDALPAPRKTGSMAGLKGLPFAITDWDAPWAAEYVFQPVAVALASRMAPARVHLLDTSKLSTPDNYNRSIPGAPDIVACVDGRYVEIELKTANGKPTGPQERESERVGITGGTYVVARTMREVFEALGLEVPE